MWNSRFMALMTIMVAVLSSAVALAQGGYFSARTSTPLLGGTDRLQSLGGFWMYPKVYSEPLYAEPVYINPRPAVLPQTSASVDADIDKDGNALIKWSGEPSVVDHIVFSLLDSRKKVIIEQKVDRLPTHARFPLTNKSAHYRVTVHYLNGTKSIVTSLL